MSGAAHLLTRFLLLLGLLVIVNFVLPRALPGDPLATLNAGGGADLGIALTAEQRAQLAAYYGLDLPLGVQLGHYVAALARFDLGWSIHFQRPVGELIGARLPWSLLLGGSALVLAAVLGALAGVLVVWRREHRGVAPLSSALLFFGALPEFVVGLALLVLLAVWLPLLPARGALSPLSTCAGLACAPDAAAHLALPLATLVLAHVPGFFLVMRAAMLSERSKEYIQLARAKGLTELRVALRHAARNAVLPLVALFAARAGFVVGGVVVVETLFAYPGIGQLALEAVLARDYPLLQALFLIAGVAVLLANAFGDAVIWRLDPRPAAR